MELDRSLQVRARVLGVRFEVLWQSTLGHGLPSRPLVPQQRQDGMEERRRRQFDLSTLREFTVQRDHPLEQSHLLVEQESFFHLGEVAPLVSQLAQFGILLEDERMNPREIVPDLQVANVLRREPRGRLLGRVMPALLLQFLIARVRMNHPRRAHEELFEQVLRVVFAQPVRWHPRHFQMPVAQPLLGVPLQLQQQTRDEVDRAAELGHLLEVQRHPDVILCAVQTDPRHQRFAADVVGVVRLVLVPDEREGNGVHREVRVRRSGSPDPLVRTGQTSGPRGPDHGQFVRTPPPPEGKREKKSHRNSFLTVFNVHQLLKFEQNLPHIEGIIG